MGRDPLEGEQRCPRQANPCRPVECFLQPVPGSVMEGTVRVHGVEQDARIDDHSGVFPVIKEFERLRHVGDVHLQAEVARALLERPPGRTICTESRAGQLVHCFAQANVALAPDLLGCGRHIVIESYRRAHAFKISISDARIAASLMPAGWLQLIEAATPSRTGHGVPASRGRPRDVATCAPLGDDTGSGRPQDLDLGG